MTGCWIVRVLSLGDDNSKFIKSPSAIDVLDWVPESTDKTLCQVVAHSIADQEISNAAWAGLGVGRDVSRKKTKETSNVS
jgi:hypothetical protein